MNCRRYFLILVNFLKVKYDVLKIIGGANAPYPPGSTVRACLYLQLTCMKRDMHCVRDENEKCCYRQ